MDDLQRVEARLRYLRRGKPTAKRRAEVEALLQSKWEGIQVSAAHVLGEWGEEQSVTALRRWLMEGRSNPTVVDEAAKALGRCVGDGDVEWALDLYFAQRGWGLSLWPLVIGLPRRSTLMRLKREARDDSPNREAAKIALRWIAGHDHWVAENPRAAGKTPPKSRRL